MDANGQRIIEYLGEVSCKARGGDYSGAALSLNEFILSFQDFMKSDFGKGRDPKITYSLQTMLLMIERKDWVAVADIIDYEFIPLWKEAFPS
jgi:hypothetical protein